MIMSNSIFLVSLLFLGISFLVSAVLKSKFTKYSKIGLANGLSGREIAEKMLRENGIFDVKVISVEGFLSDHYNPANKTVNLSLDVYNGTSVSAAAANNRQNVIKAFSGHPGFGVIILSPLAVGFGVNIQAANHVIHYLRHWNPAKEDQATDRAYRIGQSKDVYVYCPGAVDD